MIERVSLPNRHALSRRRLITVGAGAAVGVLAGLSPRRAGAVLKLDVTQGTIQPVPIAIPDFVAVGLPDSAGGRNVSQIIASNLRRSVCCFIPATMNGRRTSSRSTRCAIGSPG